MSPWGHTWIILRVNVSSMQLNILGIHHHNLFPLSQFSLKYSNWLPWFPNGSEWLHSPLFRFYSLTHKLLLTKPIRSVPLNPTSATPQASQLKSPPAVDHAASQNLITYGFFKSRKMMNDKKHMFILKPVVHKSFQFFAMKVSLGLCVCLLSAGVIVC